MDNFNPFETEEEFLSDIHGYFVSILNDMTWPAAVTTEAVTSPESGNDIAMSDYMIPNDAASTLGLGYAGVTTDIISAQEQPSSAVDEDRSRCNVQEKKKEVPRKKYMHQCTESDAARMEENERKKFLKQIRKAKISKEFRDQKKAEAKILRMNCLQTVKASAQLISFIDKLQKCKEQKEEVNEKTALEMVNDVLKGYS